MSHDIACRIFLGGKKHVGAFVLVDEQDFDFLNGWKWSWKTGYAGRSASHGESLEHSNVLIRKVILMHKVIQPCDAPLQVDHINGDKLDNRRCNLRVVTPNQNQTNRKKYSTNTSGYTGVSFVERSKLNPWRAMIRIFADGISKPHHIGNFATPEEASAAYQAAAIKMRGEHHRK